MLAGSAEIGDALYGKMAILVFARASDVESGAFRLLGSNQRPVVLRAMRGGCKVRDARTRARTRACAGWLVVRVLGKRGERCLVDRYSATPSNPSIHHPHILFSHRRRA